jgi:hypothetical protein
MPKKSPSHIGTIKQTNKELPSLGRRKVNADLSPGDSDTDWLPYDAHMTSGEKACKPFSLKLSSSPVTAYSFLALFQEDSGTFSLSTT